MRLFSGRPGAEDAQQLLVIPPQAWEMVDVGTGGAKMVTSGGLVWESMGLYGFI